MSDSLMPQKGTRQRKMFHCNVHKEKACAVYQPRPYGHSWCAPPEESDAHTKFGWRKRERGLPPPSGTLFNNKDLQRTHPCSLQAECAARPPTVAHYLIVFSFPAPLIHSFTPPCLLLHTQTHTHSDPQSFYPMSKLGLCAKSLRFSSSPSLITTDCLNSEHQRSCLHFLMSWSK